MYSSLDFSEFSIFHFRFNFRKYFDNKLLPIFNIVKTWKYVYKQACEVDLSFPFISSAFLYKEVICESRYTCVFLFYNFYPMFDTSIAFFHNLIFYLHIFFTYTRRKFSSEMLPKNLVNHGYSSIFVFFTK